MTFQIEVVVGVRRRFDVRAVSRAARPHAKLGFQARANRSAKRRGRSALMKMQLSRGQRVLFASGAQAVDRAGARAVTWSALADDCTS
jgi:hypothetical protein